MSKSVLVMDTPESCSKCMFLYEFSGIKKCNLMNILCGGASKLSQNNFIECRHEKCPLKPMPEKMQVCGKYPQPDGVTPSYKFGWNACIDAICGEETGNEK